MTSRDGTRIAVDRVGNGPPLVVVTGAFNDRHTFAELGELLAPDVTVHRYDRRGRGDSGSTLPYAVDREVDDLDAVITEAGGPAFVFGHSSGAALALTAVSRGLAISRVAVYEPPFIVDDSRPPFPPGYGAHLESLVAAGRRGEAVEYFLAKVVGMPAEAVAGIRGSGEWPSLEANAHTLPHEAAIMDSMKTSDPLPAAWATSVTVPTLVMEGDRSPLWQRNSVAALVELLPRAERRSLQGQGHGPDPKLLAPILRAFFAG